MIGISLPYSWLVGDDQLPEPKALLPMLKEHGVRSIEVRMVPLGASADEVLRIAELLWNYGFNITVHGTVKSEKDAVAEVLEPLTEVLRHMKQTKLNVTVHPIVGDNAAMLINLSDYIIKHNYPVQIALENERKMPDKTEGDSLSLVLDAVTRVNRENVGICFDMGHYAWYADQVLKNPSARPPKEFLSRVIHTHIHAYTEGTTHYPIAEWREPLASYIHELDFEYYGVYNLELSPQRFAHRWGAVEAYLLSVDMLRAHFPFHASMYEDLRLHYDERFQRALKVFETKKGCNAALIGATAYLFCTNGYRWAMDIAFRCSRFLTETPSKVCEYLGDVDLMILTHAHEDHMEESTIRALADTEIQWLVPEFMVKYLLEYGVRPEKMIVVSAGETLQVGPLSIRVLPGRHFRPNTENGIEAVGYQITAEKAPTLVFPGDIRDYRTENVEKLEADYCFAHVWLSDQAMDPKQYIPKSEELAEFMLRMSDQNIMLTHLYEVARKEESMWQRHHAELVEEAIHKRSPQTTVQIPKVGEVLHLS